MPIIYEDRGYVYKGIPVKPGSVYRYDGKTVVLIDYIDKSTICRVAPHLHAKKDIVAIKSLTYLPSKSPPHFDTNESALSLLKGGL